MEKYTACSVRMKNKKWQARLRYKDGNRWKNLDKMLPEATGKKEAERLAEELRQDLNKALNTAGDGEVNKTVDEVVRAYLDHQFAIGVLEKSTYNTQMHNYKKNIEPYLGDYIFNTLDRTAIMDWHTKLSNKGLSQHAIYYTSTIITKVYNYYLEVGEITKNPFRTVKGLGKSKINRVTHLTQEQMEKFLDCVFMTYEPKDPMYAGILLAFYGALRRSEICGLRWLDIDFEENTITISSSIGIGEGGTYTKGTKNKSSNRTFPMIPQLATCLRQRYEAIHPERNWFVCGEETSYMAPNTFNRKFNEFIYAYDLKDAYGKYITPHALRHNAASVGVRSGMDISALSLMMGHASRAMTLDVYADASEQSKRIGAERLSAAFTKETDDKDYYQK